MAKKGRPRAEEKQLPEVETEQEIEQEIPVEEEEKTEQQNKQQISGWELVSESELAKYQKQGIVAGYDPKTKMALLNR